MRLSRVEFAAMNNPVRRFVQKHLELRTFERMGLTEKGKDILEIGCGSGYGAVLLSTLDPSSYHGIDIMPEQIEIARRTGPAGYEFSVMDATDMSAIDSESKDIVVVFGILHHIPEWRKVLGECHRVMRPGGRLFIEEPDERLLRPLDAIFSLGHPREARFRLSELERDLEAVGLAIDRRKRIIPGFGSYRARKCLSAD